MPELRLVAIPGFSNMARAEANECFWLASGELWYFLSSLLLSLWLGFAATLTGTGRVSFEESGELLCWLVVTRNGSFEVTWLSGAKWPAATFTGTGRESLDESGELLCWLFVTRNGSFEATWLRGAKWPG